MNRVHIRPMRYSDGFLFTRANENFNCTHGFVEIGPGTDFTLKVWTGIDGNYGIKLSDVLSKYNCRAEVI